MPEPLDRAALDELSAMTGGDATLVVELLDTFLSDAELYLGELRAAVDGADPEGLVRPAHSLKSNAMTVGALRLADLCRRLEADARSSAVDDAAERVGEVAAELDGVRDAVRREREAVAGA